MEKKRKRWKIVYQDGSIEIRNADDVQIHEFGVALGLKSSFFKHRNSVEWAISASKWVSIEPMEDE